MATRWFCVGNRGKEVIKVRGHQTAFRTTPLCEVALAWPRNRLRRKLFPGSVETGESDRA